MFNMYSQSPKFTIKKLQKETQTYKIYNNVY